jgi:hypothetical protein
MRRLQKFIVTGAVLSLALFAAAAPAQADIVVVSGVNNQGTDNVLLNPATNVLTVTGTVGANNLLVNFTSTSGSDLLSANPSGQATVSGGTGNNPFTQLSFGGLQHQCGDERQRVDQCPRGEHRRRILRGRLPG